MPQLKLNENEEDAIAAVLYILNIGDCETCIMSWNGKPLNYVYSSGNCASFGI